MSTRTTSTTTLPGGTWRRGNVAGAGLVLDGDDLAGLDRIGRAEGAEA